MVYKCADRRKEIFTNNNYTDEVDEVVNLAGGETRSGGERTKSVKAQPSKVDEFRAEVEAIKCSPWFVDQRDKC